MGIGLDNVYVRRNLQWLAFTCFVEGCDTVSERKSIYCAQVFRHQDEASPLGPIFCSL